MHTCAPFHLGNIYGAHGTLVYMIHILNHIKSDPQILDPTLLGRL
jgi:hypothetical protein